MATLDVAVVLQLSGHAAATLTAVKRLIVNADDLGLTRGVNGAIFRLGRTDALTSATLMASASAFEDAVSVSRENPAPAIGCHLVLVDGEPVLPWERIPSLAPHGRFRSTLMGFASDLALGRIRQPEIEAEAIAQIRKLQQAGIRVTHLDAHKHTHMLPGVLRPLLRAALLCGVKAVRNPFEPQWSIRATPRATILRRTQVALLKSRHGTFRRLVEESGLATTDGAVGVLATGSLDRTALASLLRAIPDGTWELVCHPGADDEDLRKLPTKLTGSREVEAVALEELVPHIASEGVELIHFGSL